MTFFDNSTLHLGEVRHIRAHLERVVNVIFPENGIEWFSDALEEWAPSSRGVSLKGAEVIKPESFCRSSPMVSVSNGVSEGTILQCGLVYHRSPSGTDLRSESCFGLFARAKLFGPRDEAWAIARVLQSEAEKVFCEQVQSILPALFSKLPRSHAFLRQVDLRGNVRVRKSRDEDGFQVDVISPNNGSLLDSKRFDLAGIVPAPYEIHAETIAEARAIQFGAAWGFLLSRQKDCQPLFDRDMAEAITGAVRSDPGGYGVSFNPNDFVANAADFTAKPRNRRSEQALG